MNLQELLTSADRRANLSYIITMWILNAIVQPVLVWLYGVRAMAPFMILQVLVTGMMTLMHVRRKGEPWIKWIAAVSLPALISLQLVLMWYPEKTLPLPTWYISLIEVVPAVDALHGGFVRQSAAMGEALTAAGVITTAVEQVAAGSTQQATAVTDAMAAVDSVARLSDRTAELVDAVYQDAQGGAQVAAHGSQQIGASIQTVDDGIAQSLQAMEQTASAVALSQEQNRALDSLDRAGGELVALAGGLKG